MPSNESPVIATRMFVFPHMPTQHAEQDADHEYPDAKPRFKLERIRKRHYHGLP